MLSLPASQYQRLTGSTNAYQPLLRAARPTGRAHMEHTEPPSTAAVPTGANPYQRVPTSANDSPSTFGAHRKIQSGGLRQGKERWDRSDLGMSGSRIHASLLSFMHGCRHPGVSSTISPASPLRR